MYGTYQRLGVPVSASNRTLIRAVWRKMKKRARSRKLRKSRHAFYRVMLEHHANDKRIMSEWRL